MRKDLLALTPEAIASLANVGLVKRAQRELAEGNSPTIALDRNETVVATFSDGAVAQLPQGKALKDSPCSCGALGLCRHRVAAALAYRAWHEAQGDLVPPSSTRSSWSPGDTEDDALLEALGVRLFARAKDVLKRGLLVTVETGATPTAKLPSCTVRFLVPRNMTYAKCDCANAGACEHLALAVWAFRRSPQGGVVSLGAAATETHDAHVLDELFALVHDVLVPGIGTAHLSPLRLANLRTRIEKDRMTWMLSLLVDLEMALEGYQKRSALHDTREIVNLITEITARIRAARAATCELPPRHILGEDEAAETQLDHLRLVSFGVRLRADGRTRYADVFLADPDSALVLVLRKHWNFSTDAEIEEGPSLSRRFVTARIALGSIAHGQVVSKAVSRKANRSIVIRASQTVQTSVTPQQGDWESLPYPLLIKNLDEHEKHLGRVPALLRPRVLAENIHAIAVSRVRDVMYSASEQKVIAQLEDASGCPFSLVASHRRVAPHAIAAVATALEGTVRFVAGELTRRNHEWQLDPLSIAADTLVVPDLAGPVALPHLPSFVSHAQPASVELALNQAEAMLEDLCNSGLAAPPQVAVERITTLVQRLDDLGLVDLAVRFHALECQLRAVARDDACNRWLDASIRLSLTRLA